MNELEQLKALAEQSYALIKASTETVNESMKFHFENLDKQERMFDRLIEQNSDIMKGADERLDRANKMVLELSEVVRSLSKAFEVNNRVVQHLEKTYTSRIDQAVEAKDQFHDAYVKLLHKYEELEKDYFDTLKEMARRPTISNTTGVE